MKIIKTISSILTLLICVACSDSVGKEVDFSLNGTNNFYKKIESQGQGVYEKNGVVLCVVILDLNLEKIQLQEATAMLRSTRLMRDKFPFLPANFSIKNRLLINELDEDSNKYIHVRAFLLSDINLLKGNQ